MKIEIKYFANMREIMGKAEDSVELDAGATIVDMWQKVSSDPLPENTLIAVNMEYTDNKHVLRDGDEVGFFPPVTGG